MTEHSEWLRARDELVDNVVRLGFPKELGLEMTKNLGSPRTRPGNLSMNHREDTNGIHN